MKGMKVNGKREKKKECATKQRRGYLVENAAVGLWAWRGRSTLHSPFAGLSFIFLFLDLLNLIISRYSQLGGVHLSRIQIAAYA